MNEQNAQAKTRHPILGWFGSAVIGAVLAWLSSAAILQVVFGIVRRDSASLWMSSGVADFLMGLLCLPAFLLAHGVSYVCLKSADTTQWRATRSVGQGMVFFWIVLVIAWRWQVNGPVFKGY